MRTSSKVTGIDAGYVMGRDTHPTYNFVAQRVKGKGEWWSISRGYGLIKSEEFGEMIAPRVRLC